MGGHQIPEQGPNDDGYDEDGYDETQRAEVLETTRGGPDNGAVVTDLDPDLGKDDDLDEEDDIAMSSDDYGEETSDVDEDEDDIDEDEVQEAFDDGTVDESNLNDADDRAISP